MSKNANPIHELVTAPLNQKSPAWRWVVAMEFLANLSRNLAHLSFDQYLMEAARHYRETKLCALDPKRPFNPEPDVRWAFRTYGMTGPMGLRWTTEALILAGADDKTVAGLTGTSPSIVKTYRKIFYDVEPFLQNKELVYSCVLPLSRNQIGHLQWDYGWKVFAAEFGVDGFLKMRRGSKDLDKEHIQFLKNQQAMKALSMADQILSDQSTAYSEEARGIVKTAQDYWKLLKEDMEDIPKHDAADSFFNRIIPYVQLSLKNAVPLETDNKMGVIREVPINALLTP